MSFTNIILISGVCLGFLFFPKEMVYAYRLTFIQQSGGFGNQVGYFFNPQGLGLFRGQVLVADTGNRRVQSLTPQLGPNLSFDAFKDEDGDTARFEYPIDVAASPSGYIYVLDKETSRLIQFDHFGRHHATLFTLGGIRGGLLHPQGVYVDKVGYIWIADTDNHRIMQSDRHGTVLQEIGPIEGDLKYPVDCFLDTEQRLYVLDQEGLKRFNAFGIFERLVVPISQANAVKQDAKGRIYIVHRRDAAIYIYSRHYALLMVFKSLKSPLDIEIDGSRLFVLDGATHAISEFRIQ